MADGHPGQLLIGDKYTLAVTSRTISPSVSWCCSPGPKGEARRAGQHLFKPLRQVLDSVNWTFKGQLDLERLGGRTPEGIIAAS